MNFSFPIRSAVVFSVWFMALVSIISSLIFVFFSSGWVIWGIALLLVFIAALVFILRIKMCRLFYSQNQICVQRGLLWRSIKRIPVKNITGVTVIRTPLQFLFSISTVVISSPGTMMLLVGLSAESANTLSSLLIAKGDIE